MYSDEYTQKHILVERYQLWTSMTRANWFRNGSSFAGLFHCVYIKHWFLGSLYTVWSARVLTLTQLGQSVVVLPRVALAVRKNHRSCELASKTPAHRWWLLYRGTMRKAKWHGCFLVQLRQRRETLVRMTAKWTMRQCMYRSYRQKSATQQARMGKMGTFKQFLWRFTISSRGRNNSNFSGSQQDCLIGKSCSPQIYVVVIWPRCKQNKMTNATF